MLAGVNNVLRTSVFGLHLKRLLTVADTDTDLQIMGGGGLSSRPRDKGAGGGGGLKKNFRPAYFSVWSKNGGRGGGGPPDPPLFNQYYL